jgi:hypothetical protein
VGADAGGLLALVRGGRLANGSVASPAAASAPPSLLPGWRGWRARLFAHVRTDLRRQVIATLGLTPLTPVFFQQVCLVGFLANLVAIPAATLVVTPLALLGTVFAPLGSLGGTAVGARQPARAPRGDPGRVWVMPVAPLWAQIPGLAAAALVVMPLPWRTRLLALALALALLVLVRPAHLRRRTKRPAWRRHRARAGSLARRRAWPRLAVRRAGRPASRRRTSPSVAFIEAVRPKIAVFQAGYRNRFGHPAPEVVARYRERSVAIVASPACGAWR